MTSWSRDYLKKKVAFYERVLKRQNLATADEIEAVARKHPGRKKDDLWARYAELRSLARRNEWVNAAASGEITTDEMEAALEALEGRGELVELASVKAIVRVVPASYERINLVEDLELAQRRLQDAHEALRAAIERGDDLELPGYDVDACPECRRPRRPAQLHELLAGFRKEIAHYRGLIYSQVTAPDPKPVDDAKPPPWSSKITPLEHLALVQAYHRVNMDLLRRLPRPVSRDGERELPAHWSFLFSQLEARTKHRLPAKHFMREYSLAAIVAALTQEQMEHEAEKKRAETETRQSRGARGPSH